VAETRVYAVSAGEGRIAEGNPGWGGGGPAGNNGALYAEALSPPPGPLARADLPLQGEVIARICGVAAAHAVAIIAAMAGGISWTNADGGLLPYVIVGDAIPASLTGAPGDPVRGKTIVASRQTGLCLLCHSAPLPEEKFQGTIGPDLNRRRIAQHGRPVEIAGRRPTYI